MEKHSENFRCLCGGGDFEVAFHYDRPPKGETRFQFSSEKKYARDILRCRVCGHFLATHDIDSGALYSGDYVSSNYGNDEGIRKSFDRIMSLKPEQSDNVGRVRRIVEFAKHHFGAHSQNKPRTVLDVGSGLGVFLARMKEVGWDGTALDPDARAVHHAKEVVGVKAMLGDFMAVSNLGRFDVLTFNRVLEHVQDPVAMLKKAKDNVEVGGFVYVEVPDGEGAAADGLGCEEFFIDHLHVFSAASLAMMSARAGFSVKAVERVREPSAKFTLYAFSTDRRLERAS